MDLTNKSELLNYLRQNNLWAKKSLSQNFLVDKNALEKIVEAGNIQPDDFVIEIGPGLGVLTQELVKGAGEVIAIEMDDKLSQLLESASLNKGEKSHVQEDLSPCSTNLASGLTMARDDKRILRIINSDILKINLNEIIGDRKYKVVANIPYAITSKIIELFLSRKNRPELMVLLVQKEVAERICAKAGAMSTLSVSIQLYGKPEIVGIVPASSFFPAPKVDSAILRIAVSSQLSVVSREQEREFFRLVHIGFASRRKTLANNLSAGYRIDKNIAFDIIKSINLKDNIRAQELSVEDWKKLQERMANYTNS